MTKEEREEREEQEALAIEEAGRREDAYIATPGHRTIRVLTTGQSNFARYFEVTGVLEAGKLPHNPFLVFTQPDPTTVRVEQVKDAPTLLYYPDETPVMGQWPGITRTDYVKFTVGDLRRFLAERGRTL